MSQSDDEIIPEEEIRTGPAQPPRTHELPSPALIGVKEVPSMQYEKALVLCTEEDLSAERFRVYLFAHYGQKRREVFFPFAGEAEEAQRSLDAAHSLEDALPALVNGLPQEALSKLSRALLKEIGRGGSGYFPDARLVTAERPSRSGGKAASRVAYKIEELLLSGGNLEERSVATLGHPDDEKPLDGKTLPLSGLRPATKREAAGYGKAAHDAIIRAGGDPSVSRSGNTRSGRNPSSSPYYDRRRDLDQQDPEFWDDL